MGFYYGTFTCTPSTLVSTLKTQIANSSDWSNITGDIMKSTTTRGAQLVLNCNKVAVTAQALGLSAWRQHNGTTGTDESVTVYLRWRHSGGSTSDNLYGVISVSKEHLFLSIEGPKVGDANTVSNTLGSPLNTLYLGDLVPYHAGDSVPTCALVGYTDTNMNGNSRIDAIQIGRNMADANSWVPAYLGTVTTPTAMNDTYILNPYAKGDGKTYLFPYLVFESADGLRGRLAEVFWGGWRGVQNIRNTQESGLGIGQEVTYASNTYRVVPAYRQAYDGSNNTFYMPWASEALNSNQISSTIPLIAIRKA